MHAPLFQLQSPFSPMGDQPQAIAQLTENLTQGQQHQILLGATGTGKTFTMANIIAQVQRPTLVLAHNKTLAAQLCAEFQQFFPGNAVSYFVSYYDYYQPEAYIPRTDTFIEKEATINEEIDKYRHAATINLLTRRDVIIVSSVSCIYGLGDVSTYEALALTIERGKDYPRKAFLESLINIQFSRVKSDLRRGTFEVLGDVITLFPTNSDTAYQCEFWGDSLEKITEVESFTGAPLQEIERFVLFPAKHNMATKAQIEQAITWIEADLSARLEVLQSLGKIVEAHRLRQRTLYDIEMLRETGYTNGIENYTRYFTGNIPGQPPQTLLDYFPDDMLLFIDESHISVPQVGAMSSGNANRKDTLIEHGFRLPSAHDNRPLSFAEFEQRIGQRIYVSATPGKYEYEHCIPGLDSKTMGGWGQGSPLIAEQIIRPTGLLDPLITVRPSQHQIDDLMAEIQAVTAVDERVLITTVTKKSAEDLSEYLLEHGVKARYLHSDIETLERIQILTQLRQGVIDVVVGINLLREGLDLPEVSLIGILDADKQGFLRSRDSLLQIIGRAARNSNGRVIMYADKMTDAMQQAIDETARRREKQSAYNAEHGITPETVRKQIIDISADLTTRVKKQSASKVLRREELQELIRELQDRLQTAVNAWEFETAALLRDEIVELEGKL